MLQRSQKRLSHQSRRQSGTVKYGRSSTCHDLRDCEGCSPQFSSVCQTTGWLRKVKKCVWARRKSHDHSLCGNRGYKSTLGEEGQALKFLFTVLHAYCLLRKSYSYYHLNIRWSAMWRKSKNLRYGNKQEGSWQREVKMMRRILAR